MILKLFLKLLRYFGSLTGRGQIYLIPILLLLWERIFRRAFEIDPIIFIGPTLASAGVTLTIALTCYQNRFIENRISEQCRLEIQTNNLQLDLKKNVIYRNICWIATLLLTLFWFWSLVLSITAPNLIWFHLPLHVWQGIGCFLVGAILSEVRELL